MFSTFTAGSKFSAIIRVISVIEQFGLRRYASFSDTLTMRWRNKKLVTKKKFHFALTMRWRNKILVTKFFPLLLLAAKIM